MLLMKRIYMTLALLAALFTGASAQNVELEAVLLMEPGAKLYPNARLTPNESYIEGGMDSVFGIWGVFVNPEEGILSGDVFNLVTSFSSFVQPDEPEFDDTIKYFWVSIYTMSEDKEPGTFALGPYSYDSVGSIGMLMDWEEWSENDSVLYRGLPYDTFQSGKDYGLFVRVYDVVGGEDPDPNNNRTVVRIKWNPTLSIDEMIAPVKRSELNVYPNPADAELNFNFTFEKKSHAKVYVRDITGRVVKVQNFGHFTPGEHTFKVDVANLSAGTYTVELHGDYDNGSAKFTKR
jgi:hypothetical protein